MFEQSEKEFMWYFLHDVLMHPVGEQKKMHFDDDFPSDEILLSNLISDDDYLTLVRIVNKINN